MKNREKKNAFTLVELLLVVTIIGILAGAVLVNFSGQTKKAKINRAKMDIENIKLALQMFEMNIGSYPTTDQGLDALVNDPGIDGWERHMESGQLRDPWGNDYQYRNPGNRGLNYDLYTIGPDGQEGTEHDVGNWDEEQ